MLFCRLRLGVKSLRKHWEIFLDDIFVIIYGHSCCLLRLLRLLRRHLQQCLLIRLFFFFVEPFLSCFSDTLLQRRRLVFFPDIFTFRIIAHSKLFFSVLLSMFYRSKCIVFIWIHTLQIYIRNPCLDFSIFFNPI